MKFTEEAIRIATVKFNKNPFWKRIYEEAPAGAKRRLEIAFWGSSFMDEKEDLDNYRVTREQVEIEMTIDDARYLAENFPEGPGKDHYRLLVTEKQRAQEPKLMDYADFFDAIRAEGEFTCFDYSDDVKQGIVKDIGVAFSRCPNEPLTRHIGEVLETAKLREVRVFPKNEMMYVRAEIRLRGETGELGEPYQLLALWDCFTVLKAYTFVRGEERKSVMPRELGGDGNGETRVVEK